MGITGIILFVLKQYVEKYKERKEALFPSFMALESYTTEQTGEGSGGWWKSIKRKII